MQNIIFFGTDKYSTIILNKLKEVENLPITQVVTTSPDSPVANIAKEAMLNISYYPPNIEILSKLVDADTVGVSASFGRIIANEILALFPNGILNLHPSLLPQYRNATPVPYALAMGDKLTGMSIFKMDEKIDNGQVVAQIEEPIHSTDTTPILLTRLFTKGTSLLIDWLTDHLTNRHTEQPISRLAEKLIFTRKLNRKSGFIEWDVFQKYLSGQTISLSDTVNPLITLRLTHFPERSNASDIITDLFRALCGYEKLWTSTPVGKEVFITSLTPLMVQIPGKPKAITYKDFKQYYL